jgi:hypothetical protein
LKITEAAKHLAYFFHMSVIIINLGKNCLGATFWAIFKNSSGHPVDMFRKV